MRQNLLSEQEEEWGSCLNAVQLGRELHSAKQRLREARRNRNELGATWHRAKRWLKRGRQLVTYQRKQTAVVIREQAKFQSESQELKVALGLARHRIEQTLSGRYQEGQALRAALFVINGVVPRDRKW